MQRYILRETGEQFVASRLMTTKKEEFDECLGMQKGRCFDTIDNIKENSESTVCVSMEQ